MISIKNVKISPLQAPLLMPFRIATGAHQSLDNVLLTIELSNGIKGYGEGAVATHITGETVAQTMKNLRLASNYLKGQDIGNYLSVGAYMHHMFGNNMAAVAAIEMALHDALTRHLNVPLWKLWGNKPTKFATDITLVVGSLGETTALAKAFYTQGFCTFKIKIGRDMDLDLKRIAAVVKIAPQSSIILDANQGYSAKQTLQLLKMLKQHRIAIDLIEQPVAKNDWEGLKEVTRKTSVCVCADESVSSLSTAVRAIKEKAVGAINIKLMKTGIRDAVAIAQLARANKIKLMIGGMMESSLAMTASAHLACGLGCFDYVDLDTPFFIKGGLVGHPCLNKKGQYDLSCIKSGIGIIP